MVEDLALPEEVIRTELSPAERLLWAGRPRQGFFLRGSDAFLIPFSIMWGGFAIFWESSVLLHGAPFFFALWGIPFVLMGLYIMVGRFWVDVRQRAATIYGITSERIVIVSGLWSRNVKSLSLATLADISLTERSGGGGLITLGSVPAGYWLSPGGGWPTMGRQTIPCFELAENGREVYEIIREAQRESRRAGE